MPNEKGLSLRFIREFNPELSRDSIGISMDTVFAIAMVDERDVSFPRKMADAYAFVKSRTN